MIFIFCCIAKIKEVENNLLESVTKNLKKIIRSHFTTTDDFIVLNNKLLFFVSVKTYDEVFEKLNLVLKEFENYNPNIKLSFGFSEVKIGDLINSIENSKRLLISTTCDNPISGMYYYKFEKL